MISAKSIVVGALLVSFVAGNGSASPVGGPKRVQERVEARSTDCYRCVLRANEESVIVVSGDGDTDLDLFVYDENDNLVASDTDGTDHCIVRVHPRWTGKFTIKVKNLGHIWNAYDLEID